ncbi:MULTISPECIES: Gp138 family membrane-puncturing spike protein [unclassified Aureimonas]|uniref:Gp138 family membrane-puncturing spike protein n=1 Tax=unclassified Aureimonas TaxID=2615206 RepID=UPI0006F1F3C9|nr:MULTISPECIES: Gp138 family membrane-puncturing spike protein [unclassified Aureimonas]KQT52229.1 hypothetical protein ASG62_16355 [Aureimonas sp. Leaf427]KQT70537.1 hypothetical protein ASG54_21595 [Aureimonas sp. Leaf460]
MSGHGYIGGTNRLAGDAIDTRVGNEREDQWGEMPARIVSFNPSKQTATIQPLLMKRLNGVPTSLPELHDVPVRFTRAGGGSVTYPIAAGDKVTLRPQMRSSEAFHSDGGDDGYAASDGRSFNLSDMEAFLDGGESLTDPIPNFDPRNLHIRANASGSFGMKMSQDGKVAIEGAEGNVYDILAQVVEILGVLTTTVSGGSSAGIWPITQQPELAALAAKLRAMAL